MGFIHFTFIDFIDIFLVAYLMYELYRIIKGTVALDLFILILVLYIIYLIIKALNMKLLSVILGNSIGVGVIAILIVFQQEVRRFLLSFRLEYKKIPEKIESFLNKISGDENNIVPTAEIIESIKYLLANNLGGIIVILRQNDLADIIERGRRIDAKLTSDLLNTIFFKNSPLHDGAVIIRGDKILAASCILPLSERSDLPQFLGLRHRAAIGVTEDTDAFVIVVSEERQEVSYVEFGNIYINVSLEDLEKIMKKYFSKPQINSSNSVEPSHQNM